MDRLELCKAFFESSHDGIIVVDSRGEIIFANDQVAVLGYKTDELIKQNIRNSLPADFYSAYIKQRDDTQYYKQHGSQVLSLLRSDGAEFYIEFSLSSIIKSDETFVVFTLRDITKYKKLEEALKESDKKLRAIYSLVNIGIWDWDIATDHVSWSEEIYRIKGVDPSLPAIPFKEQEQFYSPESWKLLQVAVLKTMETGESYQLEIDYVRSDGSIRNAAIHGGAKYNAQGDLVGLYGTVQDITEKKLGDLYLLENQSNLSTIIENTLDGIWAVNTSYEIIFTNAVFEDAFFERFGVRLIKGMNILSYIPVHVQSRWKSLYDQAFRNERLAFEDQVEFRGASMVIEVAMNPIVIEGKVIGVSVFSRNISERKNIENALRESEMHLSQLVNATFEGIGVSEEGIVVNVNDPLAKMLGYDPAELIGKRVTDFVVSESHALVEQKLKESNSESYQHLALKKDGTVFPVEIHGRSLPYKNGTIRYTAIRDISERLKTENALRESEEKYRTMFENIQDLIFQTDMSGIITEASPSIKAVSGYTREELIGTSILDLYRRPEDRQLVMEAMMKHGKLENQEVEFKTKDGNELFISINAVLLYDKNGNPSHLDGIGRDITAKKKNELEIFNQNKKLHLQNKELEQFTYVTSHDLQEPLRTLISISGLIQEEFKGSLNEKADKYLEFIVRSSTRMQDLVKGLLDFSRIGKEKELTRVDCNEILKEVILDMAHSIEESQATITLSELPILNGYAVELRLLFQNLISNAIKFTTNNTSPEIKIAASKQAGEWLFTLQDNGLGIDESDQEKIFIIFKRLHNRNDYEGTGIGLSQCKKIVELHGGTIWVNSQVGKGSAFNFTIPIL